MAGDYLLGNRDKIIDAYLKAKGLDETRIIQTVCQDQIFEKCANLLKFASLNLDFQPVYWRSTDQAWLPQSIKDTMMWKQGVHS